MPNYEFEDQYGRVNGRVICGVDEVGRGPLAGPVMAAAAILPLDGLPPEIECLIADSKKLTTKKREALFPHLTEHCCYAVAECNIAEIDKLNILHASLLAMRRAVEGLTQKAEHALIDGNKLPTDMPCTASTIIKGDNKSISIAVASIIAKVTRDRFMTQLAKTHPHYGWERNAGYGTKLHMEGMQKFGITKWHRRSFAPVARLIEK